MGILADDVSGISHAGNPKFGIPHSCATISEVGGDYPPS